MSTRITLLRFVILFLTGSFFIHPLAEAQSDLTLYTPYTSISVPPGESVDYSIDVINNSKVVRNVTLSLSGIPKKWNYTLKSGGYTVNQVSILPNDRKTLSLHLDIPFEVNKGIYRFRINGSGAGSLPLNVNVSKQGTYKTEFTCNQANMQGHSKSTFTFNATIRNSTAEKQLYALTANTPPGWDVIFKANYKQATSVELEPNTTAEVSIDVNPPDFTEAGTYVIPVKAATNSSAASLDLTIVISGRYEMTVSTPTGLLSTKLTAGESKILDISVSNTGTSVLSDVDLSSTVPNGWQVSFEPKKIDNILAGKSALVKATIKADKKAIPGDYETTIIAKTNEISSQAAIRVFVRTPMLWGWVGVVVILISLGIVYNLFRKYGRR